MAKAWEDSPYLFIVKVQPLLRGAEDEDAGTEQLGFSFTSQNRFTSELCGAAGSADLRPFVVSAVKVEMKGPHDYSSPADWPLMMVCTRSELFQ